MSTTLRASSAATVSGQTAALDAVIPNASGLSRGIFLLDVTALATDVDDTLDVYLQSLVDGTWQDFIHFVQILGNASPSKRIAKWAGEGVIPEDEEGVPLDVALAVGVSQGPIGNSLRVKWVIVDPGGGAASFTFAVTAELVRNR